MFVSALLTHNSQIWGNSIIKDLFSIFGFLLNSNLCINILLYMGSSGVDAHRIYFLTSLLCFFLLLFIHLFIHQPKVFSASAVSLLFVLGFKQMSRSQRACSAEGQVVTLSGSVGHIVSVWPLSYVFCSTEAAPAAMDEWVNGWSCVPIKLYLKRRVAGGKPIQPGAHHVLPFDVSINKAEIVPHLCKIYILMEGCKKQINQ